MGEQAAHLLRAVVEGDDTKFRAMVDRFVTDCQKMATAWAKFGGAFLATSSAVSKESDNLAKDIAASARAISDATGKSVGHMASMDRAIEMHAFRASNNLAGMASRMTAATTKIHHSANEAANAVRNLASSGNSGGRIPTPRANVSSGFSGGGGSVEREVNWMKELGKASTGAQKVIWQLSNTVAAGVSMMHKLAAATLGTEAAISGSLAKIGSDYERLRRRAIIAFGGAERDVALAKRLFNELESMARGGIPIPTGELVKAAQLLKALDMEASKIPRTIRAVATAVVGTGGATDEFQRALVAIAQIQTKGRVQAEELRQLANANVPAIRILAEAMGVDIPQALKLIEANAVQANFAIDALTSGYERKFGHAIEQSLSTFEGSWGQLRSLVQQNAADVIRPLYDAVVDTIRRMSAYMQTAGFQRELNILGNNVQVLADSLRTLVANHGERAIQTVFRLMNAFAEFLTTITKAFADGKLTIGPYVDFLLELQKHVENLIKTRPDLVQWAMTLYAFRQSGIGGFLASLGSSILQVGRFLLDGVQAWGLWRLGAAMAGRAATQAIGTAAAAAALNADKFMAATGTMAGGAAATGMAAKWAAVTAAIGSASAAAGKFAISSGGVYTAGAAAVGLMLNDLRESTNEMRRFAESTAAATRSMEELRRKTAEARLAEIGAMRGPEMRAGAAGRFSGELAKEIEGIRKQIAAALEKIADRPGLMERIAGPLGAFGRKDAVFAHEEAIAAEAELPALRARLAALEAEKAAADKIAEAARDLAKEAARHVGGLRDPAIDAEARRMHEEARAKAVADEMKKRGRAAVDADLPLFGDIRKFMDLGPNAAELQAFLESLRSFNPAQIQEFIRGLAELEGAPPEAIDRYVEDFLRAAKAIEDMAERARKAADDLNRLTGDLEDLREAGGGRAAGLIEGAAKGLQDWFVKGLIPEDQYKARLGALEQGTTKATGFAGRLKGAFESGSIGRGDFDAINKGFAEIIDKMTGTGMTAQQASRAFADLQRQLDNAERISRTEAQLQEQIAAAKESGLAESDAKKFEAEIAQLGDELRKGTRDPKAYADAISALTKRLTEATRIAQTISSASERLGDIANNMATAINPRLMDNFRWQFSQLAQALQKGLIPADVFARKVNELARQMEFAAMMAEKERLAKGQFTSMDVYQALLERFVMLRQQQFGQFVDALFARMVGPAAAFGIAIDGVRYQVDAFGNSLTGANNFLGGLAGGLGGGFGGGSGRTLMGMINDFMGTTQAQVANLNNQAEMLKQSLSIRSIDDRRKLQIRQQIDNIYKQIGDLLSYRPQPTFVDALTAGGFVDPGLQLGRTDRGNVPLNVSIELPNVNRFNSAEARQVAAVLMRELSRHGRLI